MFSLSPKVPLVVASFVLGGLSTYAITDYIRLKSQENSLSRPESKPQELKIVNQPQTQALDPFVQMRQQMKKMLNDDFFANSFALSGFDSGRMALGNQVKVSEREDDQYTYIDIKGEGLSKDQVEIEIKDGMVSISGTIEKKIDNKGQGFHSSSTSLSQFSQRFNLPPGVDESRVQFEDAENRMTLKFPKTTI